MRRNVGLSSLSQQSATLASYSSLSSSISEQQLSTLQSQLATFQAALRSFANKHRAKILSDPVFRTHFADMCNQLGVDPLGSGGRKGIWEYLGIGEWTYALAVQVVDVCLQSRERNGGLIEIDEVVRGVARLRSGSSPSAAAPSATSSRFKGMLGSANDSQASTTITASDVVRAINALEPLGCGYSIIQAGQKKMVRTVPAEFDTDSMTILECASESGTGCVTTSRLQAWTGQKGRAWATTRAENALQKALMGEGLVWLDDGADGELQYWMPALFDFQEAS
jgi:ESCRT-II complex subunit VPS22